PLRHLRIPYLERGMGLAPRLVREPEIQVTQDARRGELPDAETASPAAALLFQRIEPPPDFAELARDPVGPLERLRPNRVFVAHEYGVFAHDAPDTLQPQRLYPRCA